MDMRIRNARKEDIASLVTLALLTTEFDGYHLPSRAQQEDQFKEWLSNPSFHGFVATDDDDELQTWGQAGTLDGLEGEIIAYTFMQSTRDNEGYHFRCHGSVHPQHRNQHIGYALLICALNRSHLVAADFEFEARSTNIPLYFEAFFPSNDPTIAHLARRFDMSATDIVTSSGLCLYRGLL